MNFMMDAFLIELIFRTSCAIAKHHHVHHVLHKTVLSSCRCRELQVFAQAMYKLKNGEKTCEGTLGRVVGSSNKSLEKLSLDL